MISLWPFFIILFDPSNVSDTQFISNIRLEHLYVSVMDIYMVYIQSHLSTECIQKKSISLIFAYVCHIRMWLIVTKTWMLELAVVASKWFIVSSRKTLKIGLCFQGPKFALSVIVFCGWFICIYRFWRVAKIFQSVYNGFA